MLGREKPKVKDVHVAEEEHMKTLDLTKKVRDLMTQHLVAATRHYHAHDLAVLLQSGTFSGVPIVDPGNILVGMVTEFDLLKALLDGKPLESLTAADLMSHQPISVHEHATLEEALTLMVRHHILRIPITRDGKLIGLISRSDILHHLIDSPLLNIYGPTTEP